MRLLT